MAATKKWLNAAKARAMIDQIGSEPPAWLNIIERFGLHEAQKGKTPKHIPLPEDSLFQAYIHKHPQFRQQVVDLNSDNPSAMKLFVLAQAALIEKGHTQKQAYKVVEEEFSKAMTGSKQGPGQTALAAAQRHEETLLQDALRQRREIHGLPANLDSTPADQPFSFREPPSNASQASASQSDETKPLGFQPSTSIDMAQAISAAAKRPSSKWSPVQNSQTSQASSQSWRSTVSNASFRPQQNQRTAPAGFVQFGVQPQAPAAVEKKTSVAKKVSSIRVNNALVSQQAITSDTASDEGVMRFLAVRQQLLTGHHVWQQARVM
ncbi:hypothetical protein WJX79_001748 [Trebouxia sp. C0005]